MIMTISIIQQPDTVYIGGTASIGVTFASQPTEGNLLVFELCAANNATISSDDGLHPVGTGYETFRRLSLFAKKAGAAEASSFTFTISTSSTTWLTATEYNTDTGSWDAVTGAQFSITFDSSGSNYEVTTSLTGCTAGSLLLSSGYSSNTTTANQQITSGYSNFEQDDSTGASRAFAQADKTASGGSESATFGLIDTTTSNRLAVTLAEFTISAAGLTIDTPPSEIFATEEASVVVSNAATAPTTGNAVARLVNGSGPAATTNSVTGSGPWTINFTFPSSTAKQFDSVTGYALHLTIDAETVASAAIPYSPPTGWDYTNQTNPVTTEGSVWYLYSGDAPVTGDQFVYETATDPDAIVVSVDATGVWSLASTPTVDQTFSGYAIQADGTIGTTALYTYDVASGSWQDWMSTLSGESFTEKLNQFLISKTFTGAINNALYEYLKSISSKNDHTERFKKWQDGGFN